MVGDGVGAGTGDLAMEQTPKTAMAFELSFLLIIDIENVKLGWAICEVLSDAAEQAAHDRRCERVKEEEQTWALGERKLEGVANVDACGRTHVAEGAPAREIAAGDAHERRMQLNADDLVERHLGSEQDGAAHACPNVDEGEFTDGCGRFGALPTLDESVEDRGCDSVVGRRVAVVAMAALEMAACDEATGADAVGYVKGVASEAVGYGESGKQTALGWSGHDCHGNTRIALLSRTRRLSSDGFAGKRGPGSIPALVLFRSHKKPILRIASHLMPATYFFKV